MRDAAGRFSSRPLRVASDSAVRLLLTVDILKHPLDHQEKAPLRAKIRHVTTEDSARNNRGWERMKEHQKKMPGFRPGGGTVPAGEASGLSTPLQAEPKNDALFLNQLKMKETMMLNQAVDEARISDVITITTPIAAIIATGGAALVVAAGVAIAIVLIGVLIGYGLFKGKDEGKEGISEV